MVTRASNAKNMDREEALSVSDILSRLTSAEISALATYLEAHKTAGQRPLKTLLQAWFKANVT